jgi:NAD(P)-dependent dehydrogenase (short-subunit alcohol dehydrogenase family)
MNWSVGAGLEGQGVVVTGAGGGIGRPICRAFAAAGARVLAVDVSEAALEGTLAELPADDGHAGRALNLCDTGAHAELFGSVENLRALVHVAALAIRRPSLDEVTEEDWDRQHDINLKATFFLCRAAGRAMRAGGRGGRIVTFTSQAFWTGGFGGSVVYAASKGGVVSLSRGLARTLGPDGITVNTISPGLVDTPMLMADLAPEVLASLTAATPLGRVAAPEEVAGAAVFLASDHASYISGATLNVSGGFLMY